MKTCFLFPGQGAQYSGMGKDLWEGSATVRELFQKASDAAQMDLKKLLFEATAEELQATDKTQPAITLMSLSASAVLKENGISMDGCAGFSLGEYAALCEAGVIRLEDLFPIVKLRGSLMEKAARALDSSGGPAGMTAILGLPAEKLVAAIESAGIPGVFVANRNSPVQVVLSGTGPGLAKAEELLKGLGARRIVRLKVSAPFHCPLMEEARKAFAEGLAGYAFSDPRSPVYSNVIAGPISSGAQARELCVRHIVSPVMWVEEQQRLLGDGFARFLEAGPGTVLCGLMRALKPEAACMPAGRMEDIGKLRAGETQ